MPNRKLTKTQSSVVEVSKCSTLTGLGFPSQHRHREFSMSRIAAILDCDWKVPFSSLKFPILPYAWNSLVSITASLTPLDNWIKMPANSISCHPTRYKLLQKDVCDWDQASFFRGKYFNKEHAEGKWEIWRRQFEEEDKASSSQLALKHPWLLTSVAIHCFGFIVMLHVFM